MKKINSVVLSTLTAAILVGCGGGSSSSTDTTTDTITDTTTVTPASTSVPVTKGPLLMAKAVDSSSPAKTGIQIEGTNKYTFSGAITYPITVTGGYVDVNNSGDVDAGDYAFTGKLSSYSDVVTPITTYLGDTSKDAGKAKLATLKTLTGANDDDLLKKDPKDVSGEVLSLNAAIYQTYATLMNNDDTDDDETEGDNSLSTKYDDYKTAINGTTNLSDALNAVEQKLKTESNVIELDELDAEKIKFTKKA